MNNIKIGEMGEEIARNYLINNGYLILANNYKDNKYEIDIIARQNNGDLVFCEVKALNTNYPYVDDFNRLAPEDNLTKAKYSKMTRAANLFLARNPWVVKMGNSWQVDLIAIDLICGKFSALRHYKNL